uniref:Uncharacterized protein n=1 Tax=Malurus cyaneus samueli TaxID=2593467 RepID=A0A8C5T646_9PASS
MRSRAALPGVGSSREGTRGVSGQWARRGLKGPVAVGRNGAPWPRGLQHPPRGSSGLPAFPRCPSARRWPCLQEQPCTGLARGAALPKGCKSPSEPKNAGRVLTRPLQSQGPLPKGRDKPVGKSGHSSGRPCEQLGVAGGKRAHLTRTGDKMAVQEMTRQATNGSREFSLCQATLQQLVCRELSTSLLV